MRVILRENIESLGKKGDIVNVAPGYGRNYLIPKKIAIEVTSRNMKMIEIEQRVLQKGLEKEMASYKEIIDRLNAVTLSFTRKTSEKDVIFGSVSSTDIRDALVAQGFDVEKKKIILDEPIKRLGNFTVPIKIFHEERAEVKIEVIKEGEPGIKEDKEPELELGGEEAAVAEMGEEPQEGPVGEDKKEEVTPPVGVDAQDVIPEALEKPEPEAEVVEDFPEEKKGASEEVRALPKEGEEVPQDAEKRTPVESPAVEDEKEPEKEPSLEETKESPETTKEGSEEAVKNLEDTDVPSEEPEGTDEEKDSQEAGSKDNK